MKPWGRVLQSRPGRMAVFVCAAVLITLFFTTEMSILFPQTDYDYVVFRMVGDGWREGFVPYRDLFDHKGPLLYVIQIAGGFLGGGKLGLWLLGVAAAALSFELMYRCGRLLGASDGTNAVALLLGAAAYSVFVDGGNSVEQWSLPFELLALYMVLGYFRCGGVVPIGRVALVSGLSFGCVAMLRINNNCIVVGLVLAVILFLCRHHRYGEMLRGAGWFLLSVACAVLPFVAYFVAVGALREMVYANWTFNLAYVRVWPEVSCGGMSAEKYLWNFRLLVPCLLAVVMAWVYGRREGLRYFAALALPAALTFLVFLRGEGYLHYFLMGVPLLVAGVQMASPFGRRIVALVAVVGLLWLAPLLIKVTDLRSHELWYKHLTRNDSEESRWAAVITRLIPEEERDSVYVYGTMPPSAALHGLGHLPTGKYFYLQRLHRGVSEEVAEDMAEHFREARPLWILSSPNGWEPLPDFAVGYEEVASDSLNRGLPADARTYRRID